MDPILGAYQKLQGDRTALDGLYTDKANTATALAKATNDDQVAANALSAGVSNFEADKTALITLIQTNLNSGPPAPPAPATPAGGN